MLMCVVVCMDRLEIVDCRVCRGLRMRYSEVSLCLGAGLGTKMLCFMECYSVALFFLFWRASLYRVCAFSFFWIR